MTTLLHRLHKLATAGVVVVCALSATFWRTLADEAPSAGVATSQPAAAWAAKEPAKWPQIVLSHDARYKDGTTMSGASGFLMRLSNGAVVASTAKHLIEGKSPATLDAAVASWTMFPRKQPQRKVTLSKLTLKPDASADIDALVFSVVPMSVWPVEVLVPADEPARAGDTVYVVAVQYSEHVPQNVYRGTVYGDGTATDLYYEIDPAVDTVGFSGAPVVDAKGRLVGMHLGRVELHHNGETHKVRSALRTASLLEVINPPAPPPGKRVASSPASDAAGPTKPVASDSAEKAAQALDLAKNYVTLQKYDLARPKLKKIMESYPGTPAAREAEKILKTIENN